jgi:hypothetical protein
LICDSALRRNYQVSGVREIRLLRLMGQVLETEEKSKAPVPNLANLTLINRRRKVFCDL